MGKRTEADKLDADTIYARVNEVQACDSQGMSPLKIATMLEIEIQEVHWILSDPLVYQRKHGLKPHGFLTDSYMPTPEQIAAQAAIARTASITKKVGERSTHYDYGANYERQVYQRHPHSRRTGY
jgi:hypothetical protein